MSNEVPRISESSVEENVIDVVGVDVVSPPRFETPRITKASKRRDSIDNDLSLLEPSAKRFNICEDEDEKLISVKIKDIVAPQIDMNARPNREVGYQVNDVERPSRKSSNSTVTSDSDRSVRANEDDTISDSSDDSDSAIYPDYPSARDGIFANETPQSFVGMARNSSNMEVKTFKPLAHPMYREHLEDWNYNCPAGEISYTLQGAHEFRVALENTNFYSRYTFIRGVPFRIMVLPRDTVASPRKNHRGYISGRYLGFFVQCNPLRPVKWTLRATILLKMVSQDSGIEGYARKITHGFHPGENDWGFAQFYNCDLFDEPRNPFIRNDCLKFQVKIIVEPPKINTWMFPPVNYKFCGHVGMRNLGSTCYFNSLLQMMFGLKKLRKIVLEYDSSGDTEHDIFMFELQSLFFLMQYSDYPIDSANFGKLLWNDTITQEDAHDMFMKFVDRLGTALLAKNNNEEVSAMFRNQTCRVINCVDIDFSKTLSTEEMNCVLLAVRVNDRPYRHLFSSLSGYISATRLDGDNCYDTGEHGHQAADLSTKFTQFAPVLVLTIQRLMFDNVQVKLTDLMAFETEMDMSRFMHEEFKDKQPTGYTLYSVIVHYGESGCGHYACFINSQLKGKPRWIKCDDDSIYRCSNEEAINNNFGVIEAVKDNDLGTAYVLTYIRTDLIDDMMCKVDIDDINPLVCDRITERFHQHHIAHLNRVEAGLQTLLLVTEASLVNSNNHGFDLIDLRDKTQTYPTISVPKDFCVSDVYTAIRDQLPSHAYAEFRVYLFRYVEVTCPIHRQFKGGLRPLFPVPYEGVMNCLVLNDTTVFSAIYIHYLPRSPFAYEIHQLPIELLVFVKLYYNEQLTIVGTCFIGHMQLVFDKKLELKHLCQIPDEIDIAIYTEVCPFDIREIDDSMVADPHNGFDGNGSIVVVEAIDEKVPVEQRFPAHFNAMCRSVKITLEMDVTLFPAQSIRHAAQIHDINCFVNTKVKDIAEKLVATQYQGEVTADQILIWRNGPYFDKPMVSFYEQMNDSNIADLLSTRTELYDARDKTEFTLRFALLTFEIKKDFMYVPTPAFLLTPDYQLMCHRILICPKWTVGESLKYLHANYPFSPNGTKKLRIVYTYRAGQDRGINGVQCRVYKIVDETITCEELNKELTENQFQIRIEEVPVGQEIVDDEETNKKEALITVVSFESSIAVLYDTSFFVKIYDGEKFADVRQRICNSMTLLAEEKFTDFKFFLYAGINQKEVLTDESVINFKTWIDKSAAVQEQPCIAMKRKLPLDVQLIKLTQ